MYNFTTDVYETKREIVNFSKNISAGLSKPKEKFVMDMNFGIARSQSVLLTEISRSLEEPVRLKNTVERLANNLVLFEDRDIETVKNNFNKEISRYIDLEPLVLLDDSEIVKKYGKHFEDLCKVRDASSKKNDIYPGYHVCEATVVTKKEKQPISLYSKIYSTESKGFKSMNHETVKSIEAVKQIITNKCTFVCDRGYDANIIFDYFMDDENDDDFIVRLKETRNLVFKKKSKNVGEIVKKRKGKIKMKMFFTDENKDVYVSHTRVELPNHKGKSLTLVMVYGLSEEKPMMLLTNKTVSCKEDVHKIVRGYMARWRIEEGFRFKKQQYGFENMRVRTLKAMNALNTLLMIHIGHIGILAEKIDQKLLVIKMVERSKSLKGRAYLWFYQIASGIKEILKYAHTGIKEYQEIEYSHGYTQLKLNL